MNITHLITLNTKVAMLINLYHHWKDVTITAPLTSPEIAHCLFKKGDMVFVTQFDKYIRGMRVLDVDGKLKKDEQFSLDMKETEAQDILELVAENGKQSSKGWLKYRYDVNICPSISNGMITYTGGGGDVWMRTKVSKHKGECIDMLTTMWKERYGGTYTYNLDLTLLQHQINMVGWEGSDEHMAAELAEYQS